MAFNLEKPTESIETLSKEAYNVLCTPFTGIRSSFTINRGALLAVENSNMSSNVALLYSTSNFLSHLLIDTDKNLLIKSVYVHKNVVLRNTVVMNHSNSVLDLGIVLNFPLTISMGMLVDKTANYKMSFITKKNNLHFGTELNLKDRLGSIVMLRYDLQSSVLSLLMRYDVVNLTFYKQLTEFVSIAGEAVAGSSSIGARMGILLSTSFTDVKIEVNSMMNIILMVEKKLLDCFIFNFCAEMKDVGVVECGLGVSLEI